MDFPIRTAQQLGPILKSYRLQHGLTQAELGRKLGMPQQQVARIEATPYRVTVDTLMKVLAVLEVDLVLRSRTNTPPANQSDW